MRIIAGIYGGRIIASPALKSIHPMSEKARGGLFSALGDLEGLSVVDAYSGSGAVAIEALSRGARPVTIVEQNRSAIRTIKENLSSLGIIEGIRVYDSSVESWINFNHETYDIVIADPPYDNLKPKTLDQLFDTALKQTGLLVLSWPGGIELPPISGIKPLKQSSYGDAQIGYYRKP